MFPILFGVLVGTYVNNTKFRKTVDSGLKDLVGKGIDAIINIGKAGEANVSGAEGQES